METQETQNSSLGLLSDEELVALHRRAFPGSKEGLPRNPKSIQETIEARKKIAGDLEGIVAKIREGYLQVAELSPDKQAAAA